MASRPRQRQGARLVSFVLGEPKPGSPPRSPELRLPYSSERVELRIERGALCDIGLIDVYRLGIFRDIPPPLSSEGRSITPGLGGRQCSVPHWVERTSPRP